MDEDIRVIIADDHTIFRDGLKLLLGTLPGCRIVAETGEAATLKTLVAAHRPQLVLLDYNMPGGNAGEALLYLKRRHPEVRVLMLTAERSGAILRHLQESGADGILLKEGSGADMLAAIRAVLAGQRVYPDSVREMIDAADSPLTRREFQVLHLICAGWTHAAIGERFALSPRTVDKHRENIQRKLGATNVAQLIVKARALGLLQSETNGP